MKELLDMSVVPIINENDSVTSSEIRFGDNDSLSAIVAGMVSADYLFLLTDVDAVYTNNPRKDPSAKPIRVVKDIADLKTKSIFKVLTFSVQFNFRHQVRHLELAEW